MEGEVNPSVAESTGIFLIKFATHWAAARAYRASNRYGVYVYDERDREYNQRIKLRKTKYELLIPHYRPTWDSPAAQDSCFYGGDMINLENMPGANARIESVNRLERGVFIQY